MLLEIILSILIGTFLGAITGLTPGIHINLVAALIFAASNLLLKYTSETSLIIIIIAMSVTHTFLDIIPSVFLGVPSEDTITTILPAHKLLLEGKAHEAILLTLMGIIYSISLVVLITPLLIFLIPKIHLLIKDYIQYILIIAVTILIYRERNKLQTIIVFFLAGVLGIVTLNLNDLTEPLLPLLAGLFGLSSLIMSIKNNTIIPKQEILEFNFEFKKLKYILFGTLTGIISAFLPGLGSSQTAVLSTSFLRKIESKDYLILNSSINTINMIGSFITLYSINKTRNGIAVVIQGILNKFTFTNLLLVISIILMTCFLATILTINFSKLFSNKISKLNYKKICYTIIILNLILVISISKSLGLLVLITATSLGIYAHLKGVNKNHLMACLTIPVILYFIL